MPVFSAEVENLKEIGKNPQDNLPTVSKFFHDIIGSKGFEEFEEDSDDFKIMKSDALIATAKIVNFSKKLMHFSKGG